MTAASLFVDDRVLVLVSVLVLVLVLSPRYRAGESAIHRLLSLPIPSQRHIPAAMSSPRARTLEMFHRDQRGSDLLLALATVGRRYESPLVETAAALPK